MREAEDGGGPMSVTDDERRERVVRCRECRHLDHYRLFTQEIYSCMRNADNNDDGSFLVEPDGFCAWGERGDDG